MTGIGEVALWVALLGWGGWVEGFMHVDSTTAAWQTFSGGVQMLALRSEPGATPGPAGRNRGTL